jgi:hypothetical protein
MSIYIVAILLGFAIGALAAVPPSVVLWALVLARVVPGGRGDGA